MFLAGDVGGTHTRLGLFERGDPRPRLIAARVYATGAFRGLPSVLQSFARDVPHRVPLEAAAIAVAGPVIGDAARLTNGSWDVRVSDVDPLVDVHRVVLLNDLQGLATAVPLLDESELVALQSGRPVSTGNCAVIAAGTGLGEAHLPFIGGRYVPVASEGGHADFAARTDQEFEFVQMLRSTHGRAQVEDVLSGPGIDHLHRFTHRAHSCLVVGETDSMQRPKAITASALARQCSACEDALRMFVAALGAEAGNLGLRGLATNGVFVGGGIPPKILPALQDGLFLDAFRDKAPMADLVRTMPVHVVVNADAGLLGAAVVAQEISA